MQVDSCPWQLIHEVNLHTVKFYSVYSEVCSIVTSGAFPQESMRRIAVLVFTIKVQASSFVCFVGTVCRKWGGGDFGVGCCHSV